MSTARKITARGYPITARSNICAVEVQGRLTEVDFPMPRVAANGNRETMPSSKPFRMVGRSFASDRSLHWPLPNSWNSSLRASIWGRQWANRLLTLLLLYRAGYEVGRYISLERIVEESKETYYDALLKSSQGWHEAKHDLRPWWNYFLGMLTAAHKEFEARVGTITSAKGAKREMVRQAITRMAGRFTVGDLKRVCPGVSYPTLQRALADLKKERKIRCLGRGPDAQWERIERGKG